MFTVCGRCGQEVRVIKRTTKGTIRLDLDPDEAGGNVAIAHGLALVQDPVAAARQRARGFPLYRKHACHPKGGSLF